MKSTNNILQITKREIYIQWHSKAYLVVFSIVFILCLSHLYGLQNKIVSNYNRYIRTEETYKEQGLDIVESLKETNERYVEGNSTFVSNPLKDDFIELSISIQSLGYQNVISNTLEYIIFVFCTIAFGIYASYVATYDFKYKTYKVISVYKNQASIILGKLLSIIFVMITTLAISLLITFCGSFLVKASVRNKVPIDNFQIDIFKYENSLLAQVLLAIFILLFYIIVSFAIGYILKNMIVPTIALLLYSLIIPILGKYDFRNIFSCFSHYIFSFKARFVMFTPKPIHNVVGLLILLITIILMLSIVLYMANKRSSYE